MMEQPGGMGDGTGGRVGTLNEMGVCCGSRKGCGRGRAMIMSRRVRLIVMLSEMESCCAIEKSLLLCGARVEAAEVVVELATASGKVAAASWTVQRTRSVSRGKWRRCAQARDATQATTHAHTAEHVQMVHGVGLEVGRGRVRLAQMRVLVKQLLMGAVGQEVVQQF